MFKRIRQILNRINGFSTPLGGVSWNLQEPRNSSIPIFREPIFITSMKNQKFISFLEDNDCKIVFLNSFIDASISVREQYDLVEKEGIDVGLISSCKFNRVPLSLPNINGNIITITFYFSDDHILNFSAGGTGIVTVGIIGFFEVTRTFHGGPTMAFHLKEIKSTLESRIGIMNK